MLVRQVGSMDECVVAWSSMCDSRGPNFRILTGGSTAFSLFKKLEKFERLTHGESWFLGTRKPPVKSPLDVRGHFQI